MTRTEHLLIILMEECAEVSQRASKALRFGVSEIQPGQTSTNTDRIEFEFCDLLAVAEMLEAAGLIDLHAERQCAARKAKREKVEKFLRYSAECGTLDKP